MSPVGWLIGWVVLLAEVAGFALAARGLRQRLLPKWAGPHAAVADAIVFLTFVVMTSQALGAVGLFRTEAVLIVALIAAALLKPDRLVPRAGTVPRLVPTDRWGWSIRVALTAGLVVAASQWLAHVVAVYRYGSSDGDSMMYHLPFATRFVQSGWVTEVPNIGPDPWVAFYPANIELIQATAMLPFSHQALVPLLNLGWLALGLLAGWCLGARAGHGHLGALITAMVFSLPILAATHAGTARVDVATAVLLLAAVTVLLHEPRSVGSCFVAGLALGLAIGSKFVILPLAGLLLVTVGGVLWWRHGWRSTASWVSAAAIPSSLWFVRNWIVAGNPLPMMQLKLGGVGFDQLDDERVEALEDTSIVDQWGSTDGFFGMALRPAFEAIIGPPPVLLALVLAGLAVMALVARLRPVGLPQAVAVSALAGCVAFFFSPNTAPISFGLTELAPVIVGLNIRYLMPSLLLLLCMLTVCLAPAWRRTSAILAWSATAGVGYFTFHSRMDSEWPVEAADGWAAFVIVATFAGLAGLTYQLTVGRPPNPRRLVAYGLAGGLVLVGIGTATWGAADSQRLNRYGASPLDAAELWYASHQQPDGLRVAVVGAWLQQPFARDDLVNEVRYVGQPTEKGLYQPPETCADMRQALASGGYDVVAVQRGLLLQGDIADEVDWVSSIPGSELLFENRAGVIVRLPETLDDTCA